MAARSRHSAGAGSAARRLEPVADAATRPVETQQLELDLRRPERVAKVRHAARATAMLGPRLALSPDEAAGLLGVSRDYFDEHVIAELRIVRRGRRILIALAELERWLDRAAARPVDAC
jgi:excisionase family DNA binding protein